MIERYTREVMAKIWTDEYRFKAMLDVEVLACEALAQRGAIPQAALENIKRTARFDVARIQEIEATVKHDVIAFLTAVGENVGPDARFIHVGLTSSDILDTALACQLKAAITLLKNDMSQLLIVLKEKALRYKNTAMIGRTHGIHAEPITFGLKLALWYEDMQRNLERLSGMESRVCVGKLSGAVGTFANIDPFVEEYVCKKLGIGFDPVSTQIVQRDRHAEYMTTLALIAGCLEKCATELRNLQRTDILEVEESFAKGQKGSSAMPHKKNPITSEQITGLSRLVRSNAVASLENIALWHERDISHSSVERVIIPDSSILVDYMLAKFTELMKNLVVHEDQMRKNLYTTQGLFFSQRLMLALVEKGMAREEAYRIVQKNSMECWEKKILFKDLVARDLEVTQHISPKELDTIFDVDYYLRHVDAIFGRI